jgi:hypothetical protein
MVTEGPVVAEQVVKIDEPRRRMASMAGSPAQLENATRDLFRLSGGQSIPVEARVPSAEPKPRASTLAAKAAAAPQPDPTPASDRKKEASILFSLESLMKTAPTNEKAEQPDEHLWNMRAEAPLFGTAQDHALLTTPLEPPRSAAMDSMTMSSRRPTGVRLWPLLLAVVGGCGLILGVAAWIVLKPPPEQHAATLEAPVERTAAPGATPAAEPIQAAAAPAPAPAAVEPAAAVKPADQEKPEQKDEAKEPVATAEPKEAASRSSVPPRSTAAAKKPVPPRATKAAAGPFNVEAAKTALNTAATKASSCSGASGKGKVQLTFAPSGKVSSAELTDGPFAGTPAGKCALKHFKAVHIPPFSGAPQTVAKSFKIP